MSKVIIKRCTPLGSKCTPHRPFVKWYRGVKRKRLHSDHFRITVEPVIVKKYRKALVNRGFCKKKLDTRFDTHCIKTGVQLWFYWQGVGGRREKAPVGLFPAPGERKPEAAQSAGQAARRLRGDSHHQHAHKLLRSEIPRQARDDKFTPPIASSG